MPSSFTAGQTKKRLWSRDPTPPYMICTSNGRGKKMKPSREDGKASSQPVLTLLVSTMADDF